MAHPPPRPAAPRTGGPASSGGASSSSSSGPRTKDADKQPGTFFLGRYRVVDEIGVGGMASVHLARMDGPGGFQKWVAIKRIHPHLVEDDQFVDMFLDEARIAAGINHANVAQVFDLGKDDNTYWIAMEYLHGEPLREVMRRAEERRMRVSPELAARICSDAAEGLHAAHELRGKNGQLLGLVHRDVTPHNLFLTYDGYTKVVDFGIAKVADRLSQTRAGTLKGKLAYMSPEQVRGSEVDRTTDIFALGVVLWELTTNQRLFRMDTDLDTLEKVQACVVPPPSTILPGYPQELENVVMKALAKRKQDRFQTGREFSRALQNFLMRQGAFVGPEEVSTFVRQVFADRIQKREAHLAWAAEVTSTINIDQLREGKAALPGSADELSLVDRDEGEDKRSSRSHASAQSAAPASGSRPVASASQQALPQMAATSLMDDDEDVPTTVAMREQLELPKVGPRPAAGMPAAGGQSSGFQQQNPQQSPQQNGGPPGRPGFGQAPPAFGQQPPQYGAPAQQPSFGQQPPPQRPYGGGPGRDDRSAALQSSSGDDLNSTVALPMSARSEPERPRTSGGGQPQQFSPYGQVAGGPPPSFNAGPPPGFNGQGGYGLPPQQQISGYPPQQSMPQGAPQFGGYPGMPPNGPQSQIETALSLPRPDPAALWLAQQEKQRGDRRNTGVLIAVVALTALCVIGIGALVYFKLKAGGVQTAPSTPDTVASASPTASAAAAPTSTAEAVAAASASAVASVAPSAAPSAVAAVPAGGGATPAGGGAVKTAAGTPSPKDSGTGTKDPKDSKEEPGFLTIVCNPYCDDVQDQGRSLGPSPVVHLSVKPGQHRITLKKGTQTKVISVIVESGQVAAQRVSMK